MVNCKKSGKLKKTNVLDSNTKCIVIPYDPELLPLMLHQCIYFSVETDRNSKSIIISYYYPKYEALKEKEHNYITTIGNVELEKVSLVCEVDKMNFWDTRNKATVKTSFAFNMPEPVLEYALNEIRLMQKECFGFKPEKFYMKEYKIVHLLYTKLATITVELKKKAVNDELIKACLSYPSAPVLYYYLKHCDKYEFDRLDLLTNLNFCHKDDLIGYILGKGHFVSNDNHCHLFFGKLANNFEDTCSKFWVKSRSRLIEKDDVWTCCKCSCDTYALLLST